MPLTPADEHQHPAGTEPNWQENYFFLGYDTGNAAAVYLHTARTPGKGEVDIKALVQVGGRTVSVKRRHHSGDNFAVPGVDEATFDPFRCVSLAYSDSGPEWAADGWVAEGTGDHEFGFAVQFENTVGPVDYAEAVATLDIPAEHITDHYEVGGEWRGEVWIEGDRREVAGLFIRDHSWGPRDFASFHHAWWFPMYFPRAQRFLSGTSILSHGRWQGLLLEAEGDKTVVRQLDPFVRADGDPAARGYDTGSVLAYSDGEQRFDFSRLLHIPCAYPEMAEGHIINDMMSSVSWNGETGFGIFELNRH